MKIYFIKGKNVSGKKTLGIMWQEKGYIRLCFIWFHIIMDFQKEIKNDRIAL